MVARANTVAFQGIEVVAVDVQVQMAAGLPAVTLIGLPGLGSIERNRTVILSILRCESLPRPK